MGVLLLELLKATQDLLYFLVQLLDPAVLDLDFPTVLVFILISQLANFLLLCHC